MMYPIAMLAAALFGNCPPEDLTASPHLYRVTGNGRAYFYRTSDCNEASCNERSYVLPGDKVIIFSQAGNRSCALFQRTAERTGWIDTSRLEPDAMVADQPLSTWIGDWYDGDNHIRFDRAAAGRLHVSGDAYWPSAHVGRDAPGNWPHIGELDNIAAVSGNRADYVDGDGTEACKVTLVILSDYLLVNDNENCGGMNVRFRGLYKRRHARS